MNQAVLEPTLANVHVLSVSQLRGQQLHAATRAGLPVHFSDTLIDGSQGPEMAFIPSGRFRMGAGTDERQFGDLLAREVDITVPYAIGRHTITAADFEAFAQATGFIWGDHLIRASGDLPVINISSAQAQAYTAWLSAQTGHTYRLPSEAEWEYAARAGSGTAFCFGDRLTCGEANIHTVQAPASQVSGWRRFLPFCVPLNKGCPVGTYPANVWGLHEVHGNVWELTSDPWSGAVDAYGTHKGTPKGKWIVTKGGSWFEGPDEARSAARKARLADEIDVNLGLRVVREIR